MALFECLDIPCAAEPCSTVNGTTKAHEKLCDSVEAYFKASLSKSNGDKIKVHRTVLPPLYLQMPGHSVTIVGIERCRDGSRNLIVLDPMYKTAPALVNLIGRIDIKTPHPMAIDSCRRGTKSLQRHSSFELLT